MDQPQPAIPAPVTDRDTPLPARSGAAPPSPRVLLAGLIAAVALVVLAVHWPALSARAIFMDDHQYLSQNPLVQNPGLDAAVRFLVEVFRPSTVGGYYQPLAMISLMLDHAMGGTEANLRPFHRTSLLLHAANTALVIVVLYQLFRRPWPAALAGLLFGIHPLTVESIPWVGERKTLLSAFFALWSLVLYLRYVRRKDRALLWASAAAYVLSMMSKPTSLPLPFLMLLLDYWPLGRLKRRTIAEKMPLFVLAGVFALITLVSQARTSVVRLPADSAVLRIPLILCHNIIFYLYNTFWPAHLAAYYPFPEPLALSNRMVLAGVIGTAVLIPLLLLTLRWTRAFLTGWLFFFVAIFPVIGVIGFMGAIAADRFAYLPLLGLLLPLTWLLDRAWGGPTAAAAFPWHRAAVGLLVLAVAIPETLATRRYLGYWQDRVQLYQHIVNLYPSDAAMRNGLGYALYLAGRDDEAIRECSEALRLRPKYADARVNLGIALARKGRLDEAIAEYLEVLRYRPDHADVHVNLGAAYFAKGRVPEATLEFREALRLRPNHMLARHNLAEMLVQQRRYAEAAAEYAKVLQLYPDHAPTHARLGVVLAAQGRLDEALREFREALRINPRDPDALAGLNALRSGRP